MDIGTVSLIVSGFATTITALSFLNTIGVRKEAAHEKLARAGDVENQLLLIRAEIRDTNARAEENSKQISLLQRQGDVLESEVSSQLKAVEKLTDKIDQWRDDV